MTSKRRQTNFSAQNFFPLFFQPNSKNKESSSPQILFSRRHSFSIDEMVGESIETARALPPRELPFKAIHFRLDNLLDECDQLCRIIGKSFQTALKMKESDKK